MRILILFLITPLIGLSQADTTIDGLQYEVVYFKSGEISTLYPVLKPITSESKGQTTAFNRLGEVVFESDVSQDAGYSKVKYAYHENGGIKAAQYTSHPDGGVRRTYIVHYFDQNGKFLKKDDLSDKGFGPEFLEDKPSIKNLHNREIHPWSKGTFENKVYETRVIIVNASPKKIKFVLKDLSKKGTEMVKYMLKPGDTLCLESYETTDGYDEIANHFYIESSKKSSKRELAAKCEDTFPENNMLNRLAVIQLYHLSENK